MATEEPTITLKAEGRDAMWIVLRGNAEEMVQQVKDLFRFPDEEIAGLDPIEVLINADSTLKALTSMSSNLGARPIASKGWAEKSRPEGLGGSEKPAEADLAPTPTQAPEEPRKPSEDVLDRIQASARTSTQAPEEPQAPFQDVLDRVRTYSTVAGLKGVPAPTPTQAPEEPQAPFQDVLDRIRACSTVAELKGVWEAEQAAGSGAFKNQSVIDAYKTTGKAIKDRGE